MFVSADWSQNITFLFYYDQRGGSPGTLLEIIGGKGVVQVNGKICPKSSTIPLNGGDEVVFSSSGRHAYVSFFQIYFLTQQLHGFFVHGKWLKPTDVMGTKCTIWDPHGHFQ